MRRLTWSWTKWCSKSNNHNERINQIEYNSDQGNKKIAKLVDNQLQITKKIDLIESTSCDYNQVYSKIESDVKQIDRKVDDRYLYLRKDVKDIDSSLKDIDKRLKKEIKSDDEIFKKVFEQVQARLDMIVKMQANDIATDVVKLERRVENLGK